jgi:N-methylhydantoinase A
MGMLLTDFRHDASATLIRSLHDVDSAEVRRLFEKLEKNAVGQLIEEGVSPSDVTTERYIDVRYVGQEYYLRIPVGDIELDISRLGQDFNDEHKRNYGYATREFSCEMVNLRVTALGRVERPQFPEYATRSTDDEALKPSMRRAVYFDGDSIDTDIYKVEDLRAYDTIEGPAVIEDPCSTVVVLPYQRATIDSLRNIHIERIAS